MAKRGPKDLPSLQTAEVQALTTEQVAALTTAQVTELSPAHADELDLGELLTSELFATQPLTVELEKMVLAAEKAADFRAHAALNAVHLALLTAKAKAVNALDHLEGDAANLVKGLLDFL